MKVKDILSTQVDTVAPESTLRDAAERMNTLDVGVLPVCANDRLVGVVTDRDITVRATAEGLDPFATQVVDIMSKDDLITCFEDQDVEEAARMMRDQQVRRLPVLSHDRRLVGIVSLGDLAADPGDSQRSGETLKAISRPSWARARRAAEHAHGIHGT